MRRLTRRAPAYAALAFALVPLGLAAPAVTTAASATCVTHDSGSASARVKPGSARVDPNALTAEQVKAFCRDNLTGYKMPRLVEFRDELPKSNVGKILRRELRDSAKAA